MNHKALNKGFMTSVLLIGVVCLSAAIITFPLEKINPYFLLLSALTLGIGSRVTVRIPRFKSHIAVSDTFIFLALLIFGGQAAIVLAAVEAFVSSWRFCNKKITVFFNSSAMVVATTTTVSILKALGLYSEDQLHGRTERVDDFLIALCA